jgi:hypothetical protein
MSTTTTAIRVPQGMPPDSNAIAAGQYVTLMFTAPDGSDLPVKVTFFQRDDVFGVGVYPTERRGEVLRWHDGPAQEPTAIHWNLDGPPCS